MRQWLFRVLVMVVLVPLASPFVRAQGGTTSTLSGVVVDTNGGVVPGADVVARHRATALSHSAVTNGEGAFSFPGLNIGTYSVTISLQGFKTVVIDDVVLTSAAPANIKAALEVGGISEQVIVSSTSEILQTQSSAISSTINTNQIAKLPLTSRSAMDFVTFMTGVSTPGGNRDSVVNGLPQGAINITLDGVNIQDNTLRTGDGFFAIVSPRLDAIEEVSVSTASQGADGTGQGAVQVKFVTRSGTNDYTGSGYYFFRDDALNANTWFNNRAGNEKAALLQHQPGFRLGGPIVLPRLYDGRNKAFFFVNYEEFHQPAALTRNRNILNPLAQQGIYRYSTPNGIQEVNLLALAAANGQTSSADPLVAGVLGDIRAATGLAGVITQDIDENLQRYVYNVDTTSLRRFPTGRVDFNVTDRQRFSSAVNYQYFTDTPDTLNNREASFPGFPVAAGQKSERLGWSNSLRSTFTNNLVNEARIGYSGSPVSFFKELNVGMFSGSVANQGGLRMVFPNVGSAVTGPAAAPAPQGRNASNILIEDTLTWLKGSHSISMGGSFTQFNLVADNSTLIPNVNFGVVTGDPAQSLFTGANASTFFPGASAAQLTAAQNLYALLTGRVSQVTGDARLDEATGEYAYVGVGIQRARMRDSAFFVQDSWRLTPGLTINAGLRYELQFPFQPGNGSYSTATFADLCGISGVNAQGGCNLFQPGVLTGKSPEFINFGEGVDGYNMDWNNFAPSIGLAWTPGARGGLLGRIIGDGATVIRGGWARAYSQNGLNDFTGQYNANPGVVIPVVRNNNQGNLNDGAGLPILFREPARLGPAAFPSRPAYPLTDTIDQDINLFDPNIKVPYADTWTVGIQRALTQNTAIEVRYVGTRSRDNWLTINHNEINIFENRFIDEFRLAQGNLQANLAAGRGANFRYFGPGTGTAPLPIIHAYFAGASGAGPSDATAYSSSNFASNTFLAPLATFDPDPFGFAEDLFTNANFRTNAAAAGVPINLFQLNPHLQGGADLTTNKGRTDFNSLQMEFRRRLSQGLQFQTSYVFGLGKTSRFPTLRRAMQMIRDTGAEGDLTHAVKANAVYDLPFGQGRRFAANANALMERLVGGWSVSMASRIQSGRLVDLGNVRMVGMTADDVSKMFKLRFDDAGKQIFMLPQDVITETIKAFSVSATSLTGYGPLGAPSGRYFAPANGPGCIEVDEGAEYGECGTGTLVVTGPMFQQHDISITKRTSLVGRTNLELRAEILNAFNQANFVPVAGLGNDIADYEVTALTGTNTSRVIQLVARINW